MPPEGCWFLSPRRHAVEYLLVVFPCLLIACALLRRWSCDSRVDRSCQRFHPLLSLFIAVFYAISWCYKLQRPRGYVFMLMPCHVASALLLLTTVAGERIRPLLFQLVVALTAVITMAFITPDTRGLDQPFEKQFFWIQHAVLLSFPVYIVVSGRVDVHHRKWTMTFGAHALFTAFYFGICGPLGIWTSANINYMLAPPAALHVFGNNFRLVAILAMASLFIISRLCALLLARAAPHRKMS